MFRFVGMLHAILPSFYINYDRHLILRRISLHDYCCYDDVNIYASMLYSLCLNQKSTHKTETEKDTAKSKRFAVSAATKVCPNLLDRNPTKTCFCLIFNPVYILLYISTVSVVTQTSKRYSCVILTVTINFVPATMLRILFASLQCWN